MVMLKTHNPTACEATDCLPCGAWWDGREFGYAEASLAFGYYSSDEHAGEGHSCAVCLAVADLTDLWGRAFVGYPGPSPEVRFEQLVISRYMGGKQEPVKPKVRVRSKPAVRVKLERFEVRP